MVNGEIKETLYREYMTIGIKMINQLFGKSVGQDINLPSYIEMTHGKEETPTKEQVINHILARLT